MRVSTSLLGSKALPSLAGFASRVRQKSLLVVVKLFPRFGGVFEVRPLHNGVDRAGLLAQPAIDAFDHINVVASGTAGAVVPARTGLDGDGLRRTDRLAELASDFDVQKYWVCSFTQRCAPGGMSWPKGHHRV